MKKIETLLSIVFCLLTGLTLKAQELEIAWLKHISGPGVVVGQSIALDQDENSYVIGNFRDVLEVVTASGTITLRPRNGSNPAKYDLYILKVDSSGTVLWARHVGGVGDVQGTGIAVDIDRNVYISGTYSDSVDFDPGPNEMTLNTIYYQIAGSGGGDDDAGQEGYYQNSFLLKLNSEGGFQWVRNVYGKPNMAHGVDLARNGKHVYMTGWFRDTVNVGGNDTLITTFTGSTPKEVMEMANKEVFVVKFDSSGNYVWARQMGGGSWKDAKGRGAEAYAIHVDQHDNVYTTGIFSDSADFDPGSGNVYLIHRLKSGSNVFISKLDDDGKYLWAINFGGTTIGRPSVGLAITTDLSGNVLLTGYFQVGADFDPLQAGSSSILTGNGNISNFIAKYDSTGGFVWTRALTGANGVEQGLDIATDDAESVYTSGLFTWDVDFNPQHNPPHMLSATPIGSQNSFVSKLDKDGNFVWAKHFSDGFNTGYSLAVSPIRNVYLTGYLMNTVDFNPQGTARRLTAMGTSGDTYIVKLSCLEKSSTQIDVEICADRYQLNGEWYDTSGTYKQIFRNVSDCDSIVTLDLTLNSVTKPVINVEEFVLGVASSYNSYQWIFNDKEIPGATDSTLTVNENGDYRVAVTSDEGCKDTSDVYSVDNVGINDMMSLASRIGVYPNPTSRLIHMVAPIPINVQITSVEGKVLFYGRNVSTISLEDLSQGVYFLRLSDKNDNLIKVEKMVKQ